MEKKFYVTPEMENIKVKPVTLLVVSGDGIGYGGEDDGSRDPQ